MSPKALLILLRPHQWLKNLMLLFPPFLGGTLLQVQTAYDLLLPLVSFSSVASGIYIINDLFDLPQDRHHPTKCHRPLAAGQIKPQMAAVGALVLIAAGLFAGSMISGKFFLISLVYLIISVGYSWKLKDIPIVELFCVASGFILRLFAGGAAFSVKISDWLFLSVFLLALFLVCGKRLSELRHEGGASPAHLRPVLAYYPGGFLEGGMFMSGAAALVTYTMYSLSHSFLVFTVPLCCFGLLAYILRVMSGKGGDPTWALLRDPAILIVGVAWGILVAWGIYGV